LISKWEEGFECDKCKQFDKSNKKQKKRVELALRLLDRQEKKNVPHNKLDNNGNKRSRDDSGGEVIPRTYSGFVHSQPVTPRKRKSVVAVLAL
jgi:hypothetical protein